MPIISQLFGRVRKEDLKFEISLTNLVRLCFRIKRKKKKKGKEIVAEPEITLKEG